LTLILIEACNQHKYIGITPHYQNKKTRVEAARIIIQLWKDKTLYFYSLADKLDPKGCFAKIVVSPKKYHQEIVIGFKYLFIRLFKTEQMPQYLKDLTDVQLRPLNINVDNQPCP